MAGKSKIRKPRVRASKIEHVIFFCFICLPALMLCYGIFAGNVHLYAGDYNDGANRLYLLSAISQALAAILAVLVTLTLITTQLAAQTFTPQIVRQRLWDPWFWGAIVIYGFAIIWALFAKAELKLFENPAFKDWDIWSVDIALLSTCFALLYLVPFFIATLRSLDPHTFVQRLLDNHLYEHLEDFMRKSINEGLINMLEESMNSLGIHAIHELERNKEERDTLAKSFANQVFEIGEYACRSKNIEALEYTMKWLTTLTTHCTERQFRQAADAFNDKVDELYKYGLEHFSDTTTEKASSDVARISIVAGDNFYEIALVKASGRETNLMRTIKAYGMAIRFYTLKDQPHNYALTQNNMGLAYGNLAGVRDPEVNLGLAIDAYNEALKIHTIDEFPVQYATTQNNMGIAYGDLAGVRDPEKNLKLAIDAYNEAFKVHTLDAFPQDYAMTQNNFGTAHRKLAEVEVRDKKKNLGLAIDAYNEALKVYTLDAFPQDYASTQNNLGTAYGNLAGVKDTEKNLGRAIDAFNQALKVHTLDAFPVQYAMTQNNMGNAYGIFAEVIDPEENLMLAIDAYKEALRVRTLDAFPQDYASTQNNLGTAYGNLNLAGVKDTEKNLGLAIDAFNEALRVYTLDAFPVNYAGTKSNVGRLYISMAEMNRQKEDKVKEKEYLKQAEAAFMVSLEVFKKENMEEWIENAEEGLSHVKNLLGNMKE